MMSKNMFELVRDTLREDDRLTSENKLLKNKTMELALKEDKELIGLLLDNDRIKEHFFNEVNGALVFEKDKFIKFVNNKQFLPDSYTTFKNKIGLISNDEYLKQNKDVNLAWPYKDCVLEGGQADPDENRDEIFWNKTLAPDEIDRLLDPKVITNFKRVNTEGINQNPNLNSKENLVIKGNNLLTLHSLKKRFRGEIRLIYIDPPYNVSREFNYNDNFNHSTWLTFMKNRLEIARELLDKNKGVIFIHISDKELHYLKILADEVFGRDNFLNTVARVQKKGSDKGSYFSPSLDYILPYARDKNKLPSFSDEIDESKFDKVETEGPREGERYEDSKSLYQSSLDIRPNQRYYIECPDGSLAIPPGDTFPEEKKDGAKVTPKEGDGCWRWSVEHGYEERKNQLVFKKSKRSPLVDENGEPSEWNIYTKRYLKDARERGNVPRTLWKDFLNAEATQDLKELDLEFQFSKPKELIKYILKITGTGDGDVILDFFAGSGTTAQAVLELNREDNQERRFILCEQLDYIEDVLLDRLTKILRNTEDFLYCELMKCNQRYIDSIEEANTEDELLEIWEEMKDEAFLSYKLDPQKFNENLNEFKELSFENQKNFLIESLEKNHLYVNLDEIEDEKYQISKDKKKLNEVFYRYD